MCSTSTVAPKTVEWKQTMWILQQQWMTSEKFTIEGIPNCEFYSQIRLSSGKRDLIDISVVKTDKRVVRAKISLDFEDNHDSSIGQPITREFNEWTECCDIFHVRLSNTAKVHFKMTWYGPVDDTALQNLPTSNLYDDMRSFLMEPSLSDVKIVIESEEIRAHKLILAAQSPVFRRMFENDMREKKESRVAIQGVATDVMKNVLTYLYTGSDSFLDDLPMALKVLVVAERYGMEKLKDRCELKLAKSLTISNVIEVFEEAHTHNAKKLQEETLDFMVRNKSDIINAENFDTLFLARPELMILFVKKALSN